MKIPGVGRIRQITNRLSNRTTPRAIILMYHRVTELELDPWALCVSPRHFAEHLEVLQYKCCLMPLRELVESLRTNTLPPCAAAITFDDGYADNLYHAKPLLEQSAAPATFFIASGCIGCPREFWWDELEQLILQPEALPPTLQVDIGGDILRWELGEASHQSEAVRHKNLRWLAWEAALTPRHALYLALYERLIELSYTAQQDVIDALATWANQRFACRASHRTLSREELIILKRGGLIEVGAHTVTHTALPSCDAATQRYELMASKVYLEEALGQPITNFSYPYGRFTEQTVAAAREIGFRSACTTEGNTIKSKADLFQLPRIQVPDGDGEKMSRFLSQIFKTGSDALWI